MRLMANIHEQVLEHGIVFGAWICKEMNFLALEDHFSLMVVNSNFIFDDKAFPILNNYITGEIFRLKMNI